MYPHHMIRETNSSGSIPVMDTEFDRLEMNNDLAMQHREAETANFYHDILNDEE